MWPGLFVLLGIFFTEEASAQIPRPLRPRTSGGVGWRTSRTHEAFELAKNISECSDIPCFMRYVTRNGQPLRVEDVFPPNEDGEQVYVSGGVDIARPDDCSPRLSNVHVAYDNHGEDVIYWPMCSKVKRCGGCCATEMLECVPVRTATKQLMILRANLADDPFDNLLLDWEGPVPVAVEEHEECEVRCRITADDCNPLQVFDSYGCSCQCVQVFVCRPFEKWDIELCRCVCKSRRRRCPGNQAFNEELCRCDIRNDISYVSAGGNITAEEVRQFQNRTSSSSSSTSTSTSPTTTTTTTTTTTPTTTTPSTTANPCAHVRFCPPTWRPMPNGFGGCSCRPTRGFPGK